MADSLIPPLASAILDDGTHRHAIDLRTPGRERHSRTPHRPRDPRVARVAMTGSGYRAHLDGSPAAIVNLSVSGAQLRGATRVLPEQPAIVRIGWPLDEHACTVLARVRWVQFEPDAARAESLYRVGMVFETWDVRRLKQILRNLGRRGL